MGGLCNGRRFYCLMGEGGGCSGKRNDMAEGLVTGPYGKNLYLERRVVRIVARRSSRRGCCGSMVLRECSRIFFTHSQPELLNECVTH
jgi:hypothetical protein